MRFFFLFLMFNCFFRVTYAQLNAVVTDNVATDHYLINDGNGNFSLGQELGFSSDWAVDFGDLNGDQAVDILVGRDPDASIYLNDGNGTFDLHATIGLNLAEVFSVALADFDADGDLDALLGVQNGQFTSANQVFLNDGSGGFTFSGQDFGPSNARSVAAADLNGDGFPDIFEAVQGGPNRVWLNNGAAFFTATAQMLGNETSFSVALGDLNGDGHLDAFVSNDGDADRVWFNDGAGNFTASPQVFSERSSLAVALGDLDGDKDLDAVIGIDGAINFEPLEIWLNDGTGIFQLSANNPPILRTLGIALGDVDQDGDLDIFTANFGADLVFLNNGSGNFQNTTQAPTAGFTTSAALAFFGQTYPEAVSLWGSTYNALSLLAFRDQLRARFNHQNGR